MKQTRKEQRRWIGILFFMSLVLFLWREPVSVQAAAKNCRIQSCRITSNGKSVRVQVKVTKKTKAMGKKLYLIAFDANAAIGATTTKKPVAQAKAKKGKVVFSAPLNAGKSDSRLFCKFAAAYKRGKSYVPISDSRYITNPEQIAAYKGSGPRPKSKKGLQAEGVIDMDQLGNQYTLMNWRFNDIFKVNGGINYRYKGKTYQFNAEYLNYYDRMVEMYNSGGSRVTAILLLANEDRADLRNMMYTGSSAYYSGIKTTTRAGSRQFEAVMSYLAERYGKKGRLVSGWILGNEIGNTKEWNYGGGKSFSSYMDNYVRSFRICNTAVRSVNKNARVYLSLDYYWNRDLDGPGNTYFSSKSILDTFYGKLKQQGLVDWYLAYHCYSQGLLNPEFWDDSLAVHSNDAAIVNFNNLEVLTNYIKKHFGKKVKVMMSEQSFSSNHGQLRQAAAFAYAYYLCEANSMVEAFIYGRHIDNVGERDLSGNVIPWGLRDLNRNKRIVWDVFQQIDTPESFRVTSKLLGQIDTLSSWKQIRGLNTAKFAKMPSKRKKVAITELKSTAYNRIVLRWEQDVRADGYQIYRATSKNGTYKLVQTIGTNGITVYNDSKVSPGKKYYYKVRTYRKIYGLTDLYGPFTRKGITASVGPVRIKSAAAKADAVKLSWKKTEKAGGYYIYRADTPGGAYRRIATVSGGNTLTYTDLTARAGKEYSYKMYAYIKRSGKVYKSVESNVVSAIPLPQKTEITALMPYKNGIELSWQPVAGASGYEIFISDSRNGTYTRIKQITDGAVCSYKYRLSEGRTPGIEYYFKVCAYVKTGETVAYGADSGIRSTATYSKGASISSIRRGDGAVISWKQMKEVWGYQIFRSDSENGAYVQIGETVEETGQSAYSLTDPGALAERTYYYKLRAIVRSADGTLWYGRWSVVKQSLPVEPENEKGAPEIGTEPETELEQKIKAEPEEAPGTETEPGTEAVEGLSEAETEKNWMN